MVVSRLAVHGLSAAVDPWSLIGIGPRLPASAARALHATLADVVDRVTSLDIGPGSGVRTHTERWALDRQGEGIVRALTWRAHATAVVETDARGRRVGPAVQKMMAQLSARAR